VAEAVLVALAAAAALVAAVLAGVGSAGNQYKSLSIFFFHNHVLNLNIAHRVLYMLYSTLKIKAMKTQIIKDINGKPSGVFIPIEDWENIKKTPKY
jgi:hypothetical protein